MCIFVRSSYKGDALDLLINTELSMSICKKTVLPRCQEQCQNGCIHSTMYIVAWCKQANLMLANLWSKETHLL